MTIFCAAVLTLVSGLILATKPAAATVPAVARRRTARR